MKRITLIFIICMLLPFGGCGKETVTVKETGAKKAQAPQATENQPQAAEEKGPVQERYYAYDQQGRRDPFLSLIEITKKKPPKKEGASPLESFSVDEIKVLAIASDPQESYALILLPNRKAYTIKKGMTLGLQNGKVEKITEDTVVIREFVKDYRGNTVPKDTVLKLHKGEE